ncbi:zinc-ribbon domain containing protein [Haloferula sargassicola]|uniref:Probable zinc-binding domain-containing protein n=1 Tax=Haloferula sargassicola TaxID=490096 RepID=A0ABP9UTP7_9BACT
MPRHYPKRERKKAGDKRSRLDRRRQRQRAAEEKERQRALEKEGRRRGLIRIRTDRLRSRSVMGSMGVPTFQGCYYEDYPFVCCDCGRKEIWTAKSQRWWYEEMGGEMESFAIRCRCCRDAERRRKDEARRISAEGRERKRRRMENGEG